MAATSVTTPEHNKPGSGTDNPHSSKQQHRRRGRLLSHLHIQVPAVPTIISGWSGRPSGPATAPCEAHAHAHHQDRPASPSLLRSPTAWIRSKGHGFVGSSSGKQQHTPRRSSGNNFHYDARSYAQNFDDGGGCREEEDARKHSCFSPTLLASPTLDVEPAGHQRGAAAAVATEAPRSHRAKHY